MELGGKRVLVDYERGRVRKGWRPARLGGGRNESRLGYEDLQKLIVEYRARLEQERLKERERRQQERGRDTRERPRR